MVTLCLRWFSNFSAKFKCSYFCWTRNLKEIVVLYQLIMTRDVPASLCKGILPWNMLQKIFCWSYTSCEHQWCPPAPKANNNKKVNTQASAIEIINQCIPILIQFRDRRLWISAGNKNLQNIYHQGKF